METDRHLCRDHPDAIAERNERHDAFYCPVCGTWLSPRCVSPYCELCKGRPDKAPVNAPDVPDVSVEPDEPTKDL